MSRRNFTTDIKIQAVRDILAGKKTRKQVTEELSLVPGALSRWIAKFSAQAKLSNVKVMKPVSNGANGARPHQMQSRDNAPMQRIYQLEKALADLTMENMRLKSRLGMLSSVSEDGHAESDAYSDS